MKSVLIIVPHDNIYPPINGGMQRCFNILNQLAKYFKVTAIINQNKEEFLKSVDNFPAISSIDVFSTKDVNYNGAFNILPTKVAGALRYRWIKRSINGPADGSLLNYYETLSKILKKKKFDFIILETLASINAVSILKRLDKNAKIFYNAHNVDTNLARAAVSRGDKGPKHFSSTAKVESNFYKILDGIFCCSDDDKAELIRINKEDLPISVVPNGVVIPDNILIKGVSEENPENILFCGSLWSTPNAEGLLWFCQKIWPIVLSEFPHLNLLVVGSGEIAEKFIAIKSTPNLQLIGFVDNLEPWYDKSAISIVPLLTGSGTRLKVLEAMGLGVPVVSTSIGAEGIKYTNGLNIVIADEENDFAKKIISLLKDKTERIKISKSARELAESTYDWDIIGVKMADFFKSFFNKPNNQDVYNL